MLEKNQISTIKETIEEFFKKMTISVSEVNVEASATEENHEIEKDSAEADKEVVDVNIEIAEPQIIIGQGGQTLFDIQRLLRTILNKKMQNFFYLNLDINDYKKQKTEHLKTMAKELADQVSSTKEEKILLPMSSYERRIIHAELAQRTDVVTESQGESFDRHIVIKPK